MKHVLRPMHGEAIVYTSNSDIYKIPGDGIYHGKILSKKEIFESVSNLETPERSIVYIPPKMITQPNHTDVHHAEEIISIAMLGGNKLIGTRLALSDILDRMPQRDGEYYIHILWRNNDQSGFTKSYPEDIRILYKIEDIVYSPILPDGKCLLDYTLQSSKNCCPRDKVCNSKKNCWGRFYRYDGNAVSIMEITFGSLIYNQVMALYKNSKI